MDDVVPSKQPMTTLFEQCVLLLGDIVAVMILAKRGVEVTWGRSLVWARQSGIALF